MTTTIAEVLMLSEPVNPARYRRYLEGLKPATLAARLHDLKKSAGRRGRPTFNRRRTDRILAPVAT